mgnify:CR=1 FL=1
MNFVQQQDHLNVIIIINLKVIVFQVLYHLNVTFQNIIVKQDVKQCLHNIMINHMNSLDLFLDVLIIQLQLNLVLYVLNQVVMLIIQKRALKNCYLKWYQGL